MPFQPFTQSEVTRIFHLSEGAGVDGHHTGHAGRKHVDITNRGLADRLAAPTRKGGGLAAFTAFLRFSDQVAAAVEMLNAPEQDQDLEAFRVQARAGDELRLEHRLTTSTFPMRYAIGGGGQTFPCNQFTLWGRKVPGRPRDLHIVTFFGEFGTLA